MDLFRSPGAGFEAPFEMLAACHDRVERMLDLLERLCAHLQTHGADAQARDAAASVMRYFDLAAPAHHEDEERHVFPALLTADPDRWSALVARLQDDHRLMAARWPAVRTALAEVADGRVPATLADPARDFAALYAPHLQAENELAFPAAAAALPPPAQAAMGAEMAARRQGAAAVAAETATKSS